MLRNKLCLSALGAWTGSRLLLWFWALWKLRKCRCRKFRLLHKCSFKGPVEGACFIQNTFIVDYRTLMLRINSVQEVSWHRTSAFHLRRYQMSLRECSYLVAIWFKCDPRSRCLRRPLYALWWYHNNFVFGTPLRDLHSKIFLQFQMLGRKRFLENNVVTFGCIFGLLILMHSLADLLKLGVLWASDLIACINNFCPA